jgi:hypothetical protein
VKSRVFVTCVIAVAMIALGGAAWAEGAEHRADKLSPRTGPLDVGIIFSTPDILLGLESYQGGVGAKFGSEKMDLRSNLDFQINGASNAFSISVGVTGEYHIIEGPISPYVGVSGQIGYAAQQGVLSMIPASIGAVIGAEIFVLDFLSVFAEYGLSADLSLTSNLQTSQTTFDYLIHTHMGNNSKIGVVLWVMRSGTKR